MKVFICRCAQCRAVKRGKNRATKKFFKRMISKKRRKGKEGKSFNFYWA